MLPKVEFPVDEPVVVHLLYAQGKEVVSKWYERWPGDTTQYFFSAQEGIFFLSDSAGSLLNARLRSAAIAAGDTIAITRVKVRNLNALRPVDEYFPERIEA